MGRRPPTVHGMVLIDKPAGMTSHDVVAQLRKRFRERRIGHAGTLDPDATGLLVVGVGNATRLLRFATSSFKTYEVEIVLGIETDTLDSSGQVVAEHQMLVQATQVAEAARGGDQAAPRAYDARRAHTRRRPVRGMRGRTSPYLFASTWRTRAARASRTNRQHCWRVWRSGASTRGRRRGTRASALKV